MGKGIDPSPRKRGKVESLLKLGNMSQRAISNFVGLSQKAVHTIKTRLDFSESSSPKRSTSGRKPILTHRSKRILFRECYKNRKATSRQLQNTLLGHQIKVSASCVRRHLIQAGMVARRPRRKPFLNKAQQLKRLNWAKEHQTWTEDDWSKVCF